MVPRPRLTLGRKNLEETELPSGHPSIRFVKGSLTIEGPGCLQPNASLIYPKRGKNLHKWFDININPLPSADDEFRTLSDGNYHADQPYGNKRCPETYDVPVRSCAHLALNGGVSSPCQPG
ncbi:uncharacterized protein MCYG_00399 [Microsporum canis CBS 113480]|uniref:Uncharacterized protein n=1 Tax=Arthroderma otae (strain ATCC MYA-4605 / CBS 113480) TaxID=554155 RepID=C5FC88_ARTOC|nr:uncharacterized protein MCYG_00399 [Microsporum canis CBS 113480]EEQ27511.1 predicted protein [Microsporum canis CBS 113480]